MNTTSKTSRFSTLFLTISIISGLVGFSNVGPNYVHGLGRALCAVFFILYMIFNLLKDEPFDEETPLTTTKSSGTVPSKSNREVANRH